MDTPPSRFWAFVLTVVAGIVLLLPVVYTFATWRSFGPFGNLLAWTTASFAVFGIATVVISTIRHFLAPALRDTSSQRRNGNV